MLGITTPVPHLDPPAWDRVMAVNLTAITLSQAGGSRCGTGVLGITTPVPHLDPPAWDRVMAVNLTANYRLIRSMDPLLRNAEAGRLVFLTSGAARRPRAFWGAYAASKAGLEALAAAYADEVEHTAVRVAVVNPGPMRTRMRASAFPGEDPMTLPAPEQIVPMILELVVPGSDPKPQVVNFTDWKAG